MRLRQRIVYKSPREIEVMREAGRVVGNILQLMEDMAEEGISTRELDSAARDLGLKSGGKMSFYKYQISGISYPFPGNICASIDEQVVHGIPGDRKLKNGEIISIDVGVFLNGYHGDAARTFPIGEISEEKKKLIKTTHDALEEAQKAAMPGLKLSNISAAVQKCVETHGFSIVKDYVGHGIGQKLHEPPQVPNFVMKNFMWSDITLKPGMTLAIEPMVNAGTWQVEKLSNEWTVVTKDRSPSAHFENTIAITEEGAIILTAP